jgi:hypothetical protein
MSSAGEAIDSLEKKTRSRTPRAYSTGVISTDAGSIYYVDGIGLYAEVVLTGPEFDGLRARCSVAGPYFMPGATGALHTRPPALGDEVLVALVEGTVDGHCVIIGPNPNSHTPPPNSSSDPVAFRNVTGVNLLTTAFDRFGPGISWNTEIQDGILLFRLKGKGQCLIAHENGTSIMLSSAGAKMKHTGGAFVQVDGSGAQLMSPSQTSCVAVTDAGVCITGPVIQTQGYTVLNAKPGDTPLTNAPMIGVSAFTAIPSTGVLIGS